MGDAFEPKRNPMQTTDTGIVTLVGLAALVVIIFFILRNRIDRKKDLPPDAMDDISEEARRKRTGRGDKL